MSCHRGFNSDQLLCQLRLVIWRKAISARGSCLTSRQRAAAPASSLSCIGLLVMRILRAAS